MVRGFKSGIKPNINKEKDVLGKESHLKPRKFGPKKQGEIERMREMDKKKKAK